MRALPLLLLLAAVSACSKPDDSDKTAVATRCMSYVSDYWRKATALEQAGKPVPKPDFDRYSCAALYRHPVCGTLRAGADALPALAKSCAHAYCAELPAPKPGLCGDVDPGALDNRNLVRAMVQLDHAILFYETGIKDAANVLSARYRIYLEKTATAP